MSSYHPGYHHILNMRSSSVPCASVQHLHHLHPPHAWCLVAAYVLRRPLRSRPKSGRVNFALERVCLGRPLISQPSSGILGRSVFQVSLVDIHDSRLVLAIRNSSLTISILRSTKSRFYPRTPVRHADSFVSVNKAVSAATAAEAWRRGRTSVQWARMVRKNPNRSVIPEGTAPSRHNVETGMAGFFHSSFKGVLQMNTTRASSETLRSNLSHGRKNGLRKGLEFA